MAGTKRRATAPKAKGKDRQVANEDTNSTINNQNSAPASSNTNPPERKLIIKLSFKGAGGRSRTTAERVPISTSDDQNLTVENSDHYNVSTTNSEASTQQADEDINEQSPTFENSDTVSPPLKKIKFIVNKAKTSTQPVEEDIDYQNPTFENSDTESPAVKAPKRPCQRNQKSKLGQKKPEENINSVTDNLNATPAKSTISAESLSAKKQKILPPQPTRKSKRVPKKSEKASANRTGSDKTGSPETRSPETGITDSSSDDEDIHFASHNPNDLFNRVDAESVIWKLTHHFSEEQVSLVSSMLRKLPREASVQEYLKIIRQAARSRRAKKNLKPSFESPFSGSGEYWKHRFENLHERFIKLRHETNELQMIAKSRAQGTLKPSTVSGEISSNPFGHGLNSHAGTGRSLPTDINGMGVFMSDDSNHHTMILSHLNKIIDMRQFICGRDKTLIKSTPELYHGLLRLSSKAIEDCACKLSNVRGVDGSNKPHRSLIYLKQEIAGSYQSCIDFVTEQNKTFAGRDLLDKSNLVYILCSFFRDGLSKLIKLCFSTRGESNTSSETAPQQVEDPTKNNESMAIGFVADLLVDILQQVQWNHQDDLHEQVFDGVLTLILEDVGKLLSFSIFGEILDSDIPGNISYWEISQKLTGNYCNFKLKSKYLIHIFDVVLKVLDETKMGGETEKLAQQAYKKIRHTLITKALGGNLEGIKIPEQVQQLQMTPLDLSNLEDLERYSPKWAIQCIFTRVGIADDELEEYQFEDGAEDLVTDAIELAIGDALGLGTDVENSLEYGYEDDVEPAEEFQSTV